jgi:VanZ family protein
MILFLKRYWAVLIWTGVIGWICFSPPGDDSTGIFIFLQKIPHLDKLVHFAIFAIYSFLLAGCRHSDDTSLAYTVIYSFLLAFCYAALTEIIQWQFIPGRIGDPADFAADLGGVVFGLVMALWFIKKRKMNKK